jgi:hypothetical protein
VILSVNFKIVSYFCDFMHSPDFAQSFIEFAQPFISSSTSSQILVAHRWGARGTRGARVERRDAMAAMDGAESEQ